MHHVTLLVALTWTAGCAVAAEPVAPVASAPTAAIGQPAPDFTLTDLAGNAVTLSSYSDKTVVLEWFNPGCPYVKHAHGEGGALAGRAAAVAPSGVVWLAINSGAPGLQGHGVETNRTAASEWGIGHPILIDESGAVGRLYGAKTTPAMYVIERGTLVYEGAPDNAPLGETRPTGAERIDYLEGALGAVQAGTSPSPARTTPYGCSVKYGS